ncbi:MAG TPA: histidine kinase [Longimicrobiaceae bacterium]|nr:histidine kinase [Longimicrobiaceae bacterium]
MSSLSRFWPAYVVAWLLYFSAYVVTFLFDRRSSAGSAVVSALINVIPAAVLGIAGVWTAQRFSWRLRHRVRFFVLHTLFAVLYTLSWYLALVAGLTIRNRIERGEWIPVIFSGPALTWQLLQGVLLYCVVAGVTQAVRAGAELREQEARIVRAELRAARAEALRTTAELNALRARLNPHFLFNTLHSVNALVRQNTSAAEEALARFAGMLRYVLNAQHDGADDVPLEAEWKFVQDYLALEQIRLGPRLRLVTEMDPETLDCSVPAFTLQPLVENAIKHAIAPFVQGGTLWIESRFDGSHLCLHVRDDGPGTVGDALAASAGVGLRVVRQRLDVRYGGRASVQIETAPGRGFGVTARIPLDSHLVLEGGEQWQFAR